MQLPSSTEPERIEGKSDGGSLTNIVRIVATLAILTVGVVGLAAMIALGRPKVPTTPPEQRRAELVKTIRVELQKDRLDIEVDGVVVPRREIAVAAEVGGQVIEKAEICEAGKYVRKGTVLVLIDPQDYQLEVRRLEKELEQANASLQELDIEKTNTQELIQLAEDSLKLRQREIARLEKLTKLGDKYVTESAIDTERSNVLTARNSLVTLQNQFRTLGAQRSRLEAARDLVQANLEKSQLNLSRTQITAPINGMIVKDSVEVDSYLSPGTVIATIEDVSKCEVRCNLRMDQLYWIWNQCRPPADSPQADAAMGDDYLLCPTDTTVIYTLGDRDYVWQGKLTRYDGIGLDQTTRTVPCIVVVDRPNEVRLRGSPAGHKSRGPRALVRGMYVKLMIHAHLETELYRVPEMAIQPGEHGNRVWSVRNLRKPDDHGDRQGTLHEVLVKVVGVMGDEAVVRAKDGELKPDEPVVVSPMVAAEENMAVRVQQETSR